MSGFSGKDKREDITKVPGKNSGVTANDMVSGDPGTMAPGKRNLVQSWDTGVAYADKGAKCETDAQAPGCFMSDGQRTRYDLLITKRIESAQRNLQLALVDIKIDKLMEKDDDIPWVLGLVLDIASGYIAGTVAKELIKLKSVPVTDAAAFGFEETPDVSALGKAMGRVSDSSITSLTKKGFDLAGKQTKKALKEERNEAAKTEKAASLSYIEQLKIQYDVAFDKFTTNILANADDAQRVVIYNGLDPTLHGEPIYKAALEAKIARYNKAGIGDIGRKFDMSQRPGMSHFAPEVYKNKRCAWLVNPDGSKKLWFYSVTSTKKENPWAGGRNPTLEEVPDEFTEAALALSEQKWGETPEFENPASVFARMGNLHKEKPQNTVASNQESKP